MRKRLMISFIASAMLLLPWSSTANSNDNLSPPAEVAVTCNNNVQISLSEECGGIVPDHLIEGTTTGPFTVTMEDGQVGTSPTIGTDFEGIEWAKFAVANKSVKYTIEDGNSNTCWGYLLVEANFIPKITSPHSTRYSCDGSLPFGKSQLAEFKGDITDTDEDDIVLDIEWYGVGAQYNWYADVIEFEVPNYDLTCGKVDVELSSTFQVVRKEYGSNTATFAPIDGLLLYLDKDDNPISTPTSFIPGNYKAVVYGDHDNAVGSYKVTVILDETLCTIISADVDDILELACGQPLPSTWIDYDGKVGSGAFLDILTGSGCGLSYTALPPNETICGNICDDDGEIHIIKYEILVEQHGDSRVVEVLRQGYRRTQQDMPICDPISELEMPCNSDPSPEGVYMFQKGQYLLLGFDETEAHIMATTDAYPHVCSDSYLDYEKDVIVVDHEYIEHGTKTETVWKDLNGDGYQDLNEWVVVTIVDKELVEVQVEKTIMCTGSDGLSDEELEYGCKYISDIISLNDKYCGYTISSSEVKIPECHNGYKIARNWELVNWCNTTIIPLRSSKQKILVQDREAPVMELSSNSIDGLVEPRTCIVNVTLPAPLVLKDNCSDVSVDDITYSVLGLGSVVDGVYTGNLDFGTTATVVYTLNDGCGNTSTAELLIVPTDATAPVNVCEDHIVVSLTPDMLDGIGKIPASSFDKGSHDYGCSPVTVEVIRMEDLEAGVAVTCDPYLEEVILIPEEDDKFGGVIDAVTELRPAFGDYVKFCCADIGNDSLRVVVRVTDAAGNYNDCMVTVEVQDKLSGGIACENFSITCLEYPDDPNLNKPTIIPGVCDDYELALIDEVIDINSCGAGTIIREWAALQGSDTISTCLQFVTVTSQGVFDPLSIKWPLHHTNEEGWPAVNKEVNPATGVCEIVEGEDTAGMKGVLNCSEDIPLCEPVWGDRTCGLVGSTFEDEIVNFDNEACIKIIRRWTVIDWCAYEPNNPDNPDDENDTATDKFQLCLDWCDTDKCHGNVYFRLSEVDYDGYYTFDQILKIVDDVAPEVDCEGISFSSSFDGETCAGSVSASASAVDTGSGTCSSTNIFWNIFLSQEGEGVLDSKTAITEAGEEVNYAKDGLAEGDYTISFVATDGCGNTSESCKVDLNISDTKAPTPICLQNLSTAVMTQGVPEVEIWAVDFNQKSEDNCTPQDELRYSFSGDSIVPNLTFTCDDVTGFPIELKMWVWDNSDNRDFCFVRLRVDGAEACGAVGNSLVAQVAGSIQTEKGDMIEEAQVQITSSQPEYPIMKMTNDVGHYAFTDNPMYADYALEVDRQDEYMNGVSTLDLVLMNKHILGLQVLDSPYKVIAADVNNSGSVSGVDLVELRQLILGNITELSNNSSWRFVDASQTFNNSNQPWPFTESLEIYNLEENRMAEDFIGVKIGDVNGNAIVNNYQSAEVRSNQSFSFEVDNQKINKGELVQIEFTSAEFNGVSGFQFSLSNPNLEFVNIIGDELEISKENIGVFDGITTVSWNSAELISADGILFTIEFLANNSIVLAEQLSINSRITSAELYREDANQIHDVSLGFVNTQDMVDGMEVYQNQPNPFSDKTSVSFKLSSESKVSLIIHDVNGKKTFESNSMYSTGTHTIAITNDDIPISGVYYYTLSNKDTSVTRKMILMD